MSESQFGFCVGAMAVLLFWFFVDKIREYLLRRFPGSPYWLHNEIDNECCSPTHRDEKQESGSSKFMYQPSTGNTCEIEQYHLIEEDTEEFVKENGEGHRYLLAEISDGKMKAELENIAENIWAAAMCLEKTPINLPLVSALETHYKYLMEKSK